MTGGQYDPGLTERGAGVVVDDLGELAVDGDGNHRPGDR